MRCMKLHARSVISFLVASLATVYVCNLSIAFKHRNFQLETEWDWIATFRGASEVQSPQVEDRSRQSRKDQVLESKSKEHQDEMKLTNSEVKARINDEAPLQSARGENEVESSEEEHSPELDKGQVPESIPKDEDTASDEEHEDDEEQDSEDEDEVQDSDEDFEDEEESKPQYPTNNVVPLLKGQYKELPRSKKWWKRKRQGTQRRHEKTMRYVAQTQNFTLPSSLKERAPAFLLIGAQKSGTMALRTYLSKHPLIEVPMDVGETHYFDKHYPENATAEEHLSAYVEQFYDRDCRKNESFCIAGESTPIYLFATETVPARVKSVCPWAKFLVILRDPVKRAISHCNMMIEREEIKDTFEMRLERDFKWMMSTGLISNNTLSPEQEEKAWAKYLKTTPATSRWKKLPIGRGFYELQLRIWFRYFPREQFLIIKSEDLDTDRAATMERVFEFLGVPNHVAKKQEKKIHQRSYSFTASDDVKDFLYDFYRPYNQKLEKLLGPEWKGAWENPKLAQKAKS